MKAYLYARVSTDEQKKKNLSVPAQLEKLRKYCQDNNIFNAGEFKDEGISAATIKKRKDFVKMLKLAHNVDIILFTNLDRFSRNVLDANLVLKQLNDQKVAIRAIEDDDTDTSTADGRFIFNLKVSLAERERAKTSERIKNVNMYKRGRGEVTSGKAAFGTIIKNKHQYKDEATSHIVVEAFKIAHATHSIRRTYMSMEEKYRLGKSYDFYSYVLRNPIYAGISGDNKNFMEPIIEPAFFFQVQKDLAKPARLPYNGITKVFSGLVRCGVCGGNMAPNKVKINPRSPSPKYKIVYRCRNHYRATSCPNTKCPREERIEEFMVSNISRLINDYDVAYRNKMLANKKAEVDIAKYKRKLSKLKELYLNDLISLDEYKKDKQFFENIINEKEVSALTIDYSPLESAVEQFGVGFDKIYRTLSKERRRELWLSVVDKIIYYPDRPIESAFEVELYNLMPERLHSSPYVNPDGFKSIMQDTLENQWNSMTANSEK